MTKQKAKRHAYREAATILRGFLEADSDFSVDISTPAGERDHERVRAAIEEIADSLMKRGLACHPNGKSPTPPRSP